MDGFTPYSQPADLHLYLPLDQTTCNPSYQPASQPAVKSSHGSGSEELTHHSSTTYSRPGFLVTDCCALNQHIGTYEHLNQLSACLEISTHRVLKTLASTKKHELDTAEIRKTTRSYAEIASFVEGVAGDITRRLCTISLFVGIQTLTKPNSLTHQLPILGSAGNGEGVWTRCCRKSRNTLSMIGDYNRSSSYMCAIRLSRRAGPRLAFRCCLDSGNACMESFLLAWYMGRGWRGGWVWRGEGERSPGTPVDFPEVDTVDVDCACFWFRWRVAGDGGGEGEDEDGEGGWEVHG